MCVQKKDRHGHWEMEVRSRLVGCFLDRWSRVVRPRLRQTNAGSRVSAGPSGRMDDWGRLQKVIVG